MSALELLLEELKALPPHKLAEAARYVHALREVGPADRLAAFAATGGSLSAEEADDLGRAIEEGCERVEPSDW